MYVSDWMTKTVVTVEPDDLLKKDLEKTFSGCELK